MNPKSSNSDPPAVLEVSSGLEGAQFIPAGEGRNNIARALGKTHLVEVEMPDTPSAYISSPSRSLERSSASVTRPAGIRDVRRNKKKNAAPQANEQPPPPAKIESTTATTSRVQTQDKAAGKRVAA